MTRKDAPVALLLLALVALVGYVGARLVGGSDEDRAGARPAATPNAADPDPSASPAPDPSGGRSIDLASATPGSATPKPGTRADGPPPLPTAGGPTPGPERRAFTREAPIGTAGGPGIGAPALGTPGEAQTAGISGTVVDSAGRALEGIPVAILDLGGGDRPGVFFMGGPGEKPKPSAHTDARGRFEVLGLKTSSRYRLRIEPDDQDFLPLAKPVPGLIEGEVLDLGTLTLNRPGAIEGVVRDAAGSAVAGAVVRLGEPLPEGVRVMTEMGEGRMMVGVMVERREGEDGPPGAGGPAPGPAARRPSLPPDPHATKTDAAGKFRLERVTPGSHTVSARATGYRDGRRDGIAVREGETSGPVEIVLAPGASLALTVKDRDGAAIAGAKVFAGAGKFALAGRGDKADAVTGADGKAAVTGLQDRTIRLRVEAEGYASHSEEVRLEAAGPTSREVRLIPGGAVRGRIAKASAGTPVEDVTTFLEPHDRRAGIEMGRPLVASTDGDGRFEIGQLPPGLYTLHVNAEDRGLAGRDVGPFRLAPGQKLDLGDVALETLGAIEVTVIDEAEGRPVAGARVDVGEIQGGGERIVMKKATAATPAGGGAGGAIFVGHGRTHVTDANGVVVIDGIDPGVVDVRAQADGHAPAYADDVPVRAGGVENAVKIALALTKGGSVDGRTLRADGSPFVGATVALFRQGVQQPASTAVSDRDARFRFERVAAGTYRLAIAAGGGGLMMMADPSAGGPAEWFQVEDGGSVARDVQEKPAPSLRGTVTLADGGPGAGLVVRLFSSEMKGPMAFPLGETTTDPNGAYLFERAPLQGELAVDGPDGTRYAYPLNLPGPGAHRLDVRLPEASAGSIAGHVADAASGVPVPGARVAATVAGAQQTATAAADGTFALAGLPAGAGRVDVSAPGYALESRELAVVGETRLEVALYPAGDLVLEVVLGPAGGRVTAEARLDGAAPRTATRFGGGDPLVIDGLRAGAVYRVTVAADGYAPFEDSVAIKVGEVTRVAVELRPR